jgi:Rieske 2Fe-2S family protein
LDKERVIFRQWQFVDHVSRIPNRGDFFLFTIAGEEIIITRGDEDKIHAHFNVCRHRGSRLCLEKQGRKRRLTCPYHAWSFELDGRLANARQMPDGFDPNDYSLHSCQVRVFEGLIFIYLGKEEEAPDFDYIADNYLPWIAPYKLADTKIATVRHFPTPANWKLVVENFLECYHCRPSHPEYCSTMGHVTYDGDGTEEGMEKYRVMYNRWLEKAKAQGRKVGYFEPPCPDQSLRVSRQVIKDNAVSTTQDGGPACKKLLGDLTDYDGGDAFFAFGENLYLLVSDDYVALLRFTPLDTLESDVTITYLVHKDAEEGVDYEPDRVAWLWEVTTEQDAKIIIDNQKGVLSDRYRPGPYSKLEGNCETFIRHYLKMLSAAERPTSKLNINPDDYTGEAIFSI